MTDKNLRRREPPDSTEGTRTGARNDASVVLLDEISVTALPNAPVVRAMPKSLHSLAERGYSADEINRLVVPKRTLARRQARNEPLSVEETDKALRLERVAALAIGIFGDAGKANSWMRKPKRLLKGATPLAFLGSEAGARIVEEMLQRIEHGILT